MLVPLMVLLGNLPKPQNDGMQRAARKEGVGNENGAPSAVLGLGWIVFVLVGVLAVEILGLLLDKHRRNRALLRTGMRQSEIDQEALDHAHADSETHEELMLDALERINAALKGESRAIDPSFSAFSSRSLNAPRVAGSFSSHPLPSNKSHKPSNAARAQGAESAGIALVPRPVRKTSSQISARS